MADNDSSPVDNTQLVLISGESGTGKSASLMNLRNPELWMYCNCEAGKRLPFRSKFYQEIITDPYTLMDYFDQAIEQPDALEGMIVDTVTFLMEMFESLYVLSATNTQKAWGQYQQYFKEIMQQKVAKMKKPVIFLGHTRATLHEDTGEWRTVVPVKGALQNNGIEAFFSTVVSTKKKRLKDLEPYKSKLLNITDDDEAVGFKHVFQTRITKDSVGERIRSPLGMFSRDETYIDNDAQALLDRLNDYYR
jgi:RNase adaptor protein for sRNA GlmZ degradation